MTLKSISEERRSRGGSLNSRMVLICKLLFRSSEQILLVRTVVFGLSKGAFLYHPHAAKPVGCLAKHLDDPSDCQLFTSDDVKRLRNEYKMRFSKVWRERKNQQDATIRCLLLTSVSTCFVHHYAHLQENKDCVTAFSVLFWFCWMWLVAVVGHCVVGCQYCEGFCSTLLNRRVSTL